MAQTLQLSVQFRHNIQCCQFQVQVICTDFGVSHVRIILIATNIAILKTIPFLNTVTNKQEDIPVQFLGDGTFITREASKLREYYDKVLKAFIQKKHTKRVRCFRYNAHTNTENEKKNEIKNASGH